MSESRREYRDASDRGGASDASVILERPAGLRGRDFLGIADLRTEELSFLVDLAEEVKANPARTGRPSSSRAWPCSSRSLASEPAPRSRSGPSSWACTCCTWAHRRSASANGRAPPTWRAIWIGGWTRSWLGCSPTGTLVEMARVCRSADHQRLVRSGAPVPDRRGSADAARAPRRAGRTCAGMDRRWQQRPALPDPRSRAPGNDGACRDTGRLRAGSVGGRGGARGGRGRRATARSDGSRAGGRLRLHRYVDQHGAGS